MRECQATIGAWVDETFPGADPGSPRKSIRALEEMVELCLADGATPGQILRAVLEGIGDGPDDAVDADPGKVPAEAADVLKGFDIHDEVDAKMAVNRARAWKPNGDGTGYHIRDGEE